MGVMEQRNQMRSWIFVALVASAVLFSNPCMARRVESLHRRNSKTLEPGQAAEFADTVTSEQNGYPRGTSPDEIEKKSLFHDSGLMIRTTTPKTTTPTTKITTKKSAGYLSTVCCGASIFIAIATATMTWF